MKYFQICGEEGELSIEEISEERYEEMAAASAISAEAAAIRAEFEQYIAPVTLETESGVELEMMMIGYEVTFLKAPDDWVEKTIIDLGEEYWELWDMLNN